MPQAKEKHNLTLRTSNIQVRKDENGNVTRTIFGTIPYNSDSVVMQDWWDDIVENISPTAFNKTIADRAEVKAFVNHDDGKIIGSTGAETLRLTNTDNGLDFEVDVPETTFGNDAWETIKRGDCQTLSFGFIPVKWTDEEQQTEQGNRFIYRTLTEVKLLEISVCVAFPAYPEGNVGARSMFGEEGITYREFQEILKRSQREELSDEDKQKLTAVADKISLLTRSAEESQPSADTDNNTEQGEAGTEDAEKAEAEAKEKEERNKRERWLFFNNNL